MVSGVKCDQGFVDLEGLLGSLEGTEATTASTTTTVTTETATSTTTASTTTTVTTETTTATTTTASEATTASTTTTVTTESTSVTLGLLAGKIQAAGATGELGTVEGNSTLGLLDGRELNVTETLGLTGLTIGRETNRDDLTALGKGTAEIILRGLEGQVSDKESVRSVAGGGPG